MDSETLQLIDRQCHSGVAPQKAWSAVVDLLRRSSATPAEYRSAWGQVFGVDDPLQLASTPMWFPDRDALENSNLARWMKELGLQEFKQFHRWTVANRTAFWSQLVRRLNILFARPSTTLFDQNVAPNTARWFPDSKLNIVESLFQAAPDDIAILSQAPGKSIQTTSYAELQRQVYQVANSIRDFGWKPGDRIAVVLPMTAWSVPIYLGIIAAGCAVVSIADSFAPVEIFNRLRIAEAVGVFTYDFMLRRQTDRLVRAGRSKHRSADHRATRRRRERTA